MSYYQATLVVRAPVLLSPSRRGEGVDISMPLAGSSLPLRVWRRNQWLLKQAPPQGDQDLVLYPRTNTEGYLWRGTILQSWHSPTEEPERELGFHGLGKLLKVDKAEALLILGILPNPNGQLPKPFALPLVANLELLEGLPKVGCGLEVWGELKGRSGRLVVTRTEAVALPPAKKRPVQEGKKAAEEDPKAKQIKEPSGRVSSRS